MPRGHAFWALIFDRLLNDILSIFASNFEPQNLQNNGFREGKETCFLEIAFRSWHRFLIPIWCQHAFVFDPKICQNCRKTETWKASNFWSIFAWMLNRFSFDFGLQLRLILSPNTRPRRIQDAFKMTPKTKCVNFSFRRRLRSKIVAPQAGCSATFFKRFLLDVWLIFDGFS